jgi:hypothetical protein
MADKWTESGFAPAKHRIKGVQGNSRSVPIKVKATDLTGASARVEFRRNANGTPFLVFASSPTGTERPLTIVVTPAVGAVPVFSTITFNLLEADTRTIGELALWNLDITDSAGAINTFIVGEAVFSAEGYANG